MNQGMRSRVAAGIAVAAIMLAGCASAYGEAPPSATPGASSPSKVQTPDPTPSSPALALPATCDALLTPDEIAAASTPAVEVRLADVAPSVDTLPGPLAREAATSASESLECLWWPSAAVDGFISVSVYRLDSAMRDELTAVLDDSTEYERTQMRGHLAFTRVAPGELLMETSTYVFFDDVWVAGIGGSPDFLWDVTDAAVAKLAG